MIDLIIRCELNGTSMSNILDLKDDAKIEIYNYIDLNLRKLPRNEHGNFDEIQNGYVDNDVDALRHAYVSGIYTIQYGSGVAEILGRLNELFNLNYSSNGELSQNMDLWNNEVGRSYGKKSNSKDQLLRFLMDALKRGELILDLEDPRKFKGSQFLKRKPKSLVIKIKETSTGANVLFYDISNRITMTKDEFLTQIKSEKYPNYSIVKRGHEEIPVSKRDRFKFNNLG